MADLYGAGGINDTSLLSAPNANTARQIQQAFVNSNNARLRASARYSLPELSNFNEDNALAQAQTSAGLINSNQRLQDVIDAANHTPHGIGQNLAAYAPLLGAGLQALPALFGPGIGGGVSGQGLIPYAYNKISSIFKDPNTGNTYHLGPDGKVVSLTDSQGNTVPMQGDANQGGWPGDTSGVDFGWNNTGNAADFGVGGWGNYGNAADYGAGDFGGVSDWTSGFDVGGW